MASSTSGSATIAVLSAGEMGSQLGLALRQSGLRAVTTLAGRGPATAHRARGAGLEALSSLDEVVSVADLVLSVVPSSAAYPLARDVANALRRTGAELLYVDANSVGPETVRAIAGALREASGEVIDGCIIGAASDLKGRTRLYLSGRRASAVSAWLEPALKVSILGEEIGQASAFKVLYAGLTKGLSALGVELLAGAEQLGLRELLLEKFAVDYPSVAEFFEHRLPDLPPRAARRAQEMAELAETLERLGLNAHMAHAAQATLKSVADQYRTAGGVGLGPRS